MIINIGGMECCVKDFDTYCSSFKNYALPEFEDRAEEFFLEELESKECEEFYDFKVLLSEEQTKEKMNVAFVFSGYKTEEEFSLDFQDDFVEMSCNGMDCDVYDYDRYVKDFEDIILSEYAGTAMKSLLTTLEGVEPSSWELKEDSPLRRIHMIFSAELTKQKKPVIFHFYISNPICHVVSYVCYEF